MSVLDQLAREQFLDTGSLTLAAGATWWQSVAPALAANPAFPAAGQKRLVGDVHSSVAPGTIQIQFSPDATNWDLTLPLTADPNNATEFPFDVAIILPYFRFVVIDAGAGSTVRITAWVFEQGSGPANLGIGPAPAPTPTTSTAQAEQTAQAATFQYVAASVVKGLASVTVEESTGGAGAQGEVRLGTLNTSPVACYFALGASQEKTVSFAIPPNASGGIRVTIVSGSVNVDVATT